MASRTKKPSTRRPSVGFGGYFLLTYWLICLLIFLCTDLFIDLYVDVVYSQIFWYASIISLFLTSYTIYLLGKSIFSSWYTYLILPLLFFALYLSSAYFTALKLDFLLSASLKSEQKLVLPVKDVQRVFARKAGNVNSNVTLKYRNQLILFTGTRTSYFLLKPYPTLEVNLGKSYLGTYYITDINVPSQMRWAARAAYLQDWFTRHYWLLIALPLIMLFSWIKDRYFPSKIVAMPNAKNSFGILFRRVAVILIIIFALGILGILLLGLLT